jgi:hypothetical protein
MSLQSLYVDFGGARKPNEVLGFSKYKRLCQVLSQKGRLAGNLHIKGKQLRIVPM